MFKKMLSTLLILAAIASGFSISAYAAEPELSVYESDMENVGAKAFSSKEIYDKLDTLRSKFPAGKYWNHVGSDTVNLNGCTSTPCPSDAHLINGVKQCNGQADGFARKLGYDIFGADASTWARVSYNPSTLCVGDIIRYSDKHTFIITGFTYDAPEEFLVADCNWDFCCGIRWDAYFSGADFFGGGKNVDYVLHYQGNSLTRAAYLADPPAGVVGKIILGNDDLIIPAGNSLKIDVKSVLPARDKNSVSFTSLNTGIAKVDASGVVTGVAEGITFITVKSPSAVVTCYVEIRAATKINRLYGMGRIDTANAIADYGWKSTGAANAILANGLSFADALAGVPLSKALDAPIFLTANESAGIEKSVSDKLKALKVKNVFILGGPYAVSDSIVNKLKASGYTVKRIYGQSRFDTSIAIAKELEARVGKRDSTVFVANGFNFPDVLSVSAVAAINGNPILYVDQKGMLDTATSNYIRSAKFANARAVGGAYVVNDSTLVALSGFGIGNVKRIAGTSRFDTCFEVLNTYGSLFSGTKGVALATGMAFPDALAGGALAAKLGIPLVLTGEDGPTADTQMWLSLRNSDTMYVFGGPYVVPDEIMYKYAG